MDSERTRHHELFRAALADPRQEPGDSRGRGIVTCGSLKFTPYLWILVRSLRHHGCSLPIELWHMAGEVNVALERWLAPYGVIFRDAGPLGWGTSRQFNGAHGIKPYAVLHSSFREVLFLDADNSVSRDPTFLFDTPEYQRLGALFWSDPVPMTGRLGADELRTDFGLTPGGDEFETGQFVVDKSRCWPALALTLHLNERSDYYYRFLYGDKETFRMAFDATRTPYLLVKQPPHAPRRDWWRTGHVQYGIDERPLFHHRVGPKWESLVTRAGNHDLAHLPPGVVREMFVELRRQWPRIMPARERLRPYLGVLKRSTVPRRLRPYLGRLKVALTRGARAPASDD